MTENVIEAVNVCRAFGRVEVVKSLNLQVKRGSIYGFLGRNAAGKTTVIKMLAGLIWPDSGELRVNGVVPRQFSAEDRLKIGYMSEKQILMPYMKIEALMRFTSHFYPDWDQAVCERTLKKFNLDRRKRIMDLSQGGTRQIAFMLALAQKPDLLILDEPAANLDVVARREFLDEMLELIRQEGKTVFFSSHILSDIERVADEIGIMANGRLLLSESLDEMKDTIKQVRFHSFAGGMKEFSIPDALHLRTSNGEALATMRVRDVCEIQKVSATNQCQFEVRDLGLEDIFVEVVKGGA